MPVTNRVPNGYPEQLKKAKELVKNGMKRIEKMNLDSNRVFDTLKATFSITNYYFEDEETDKLIYHIDMDFVYNSIPISFFVLLNRITGKIEVGKTVVVWLNKNDKNGEEYWVDNYKW